MKKTQRQLFSLTKRCLLLVVLSLGQTAWAGWVAYNDFGAPSHRDNSVTRIGVTSAELKAGAIVSFGQASDQPSAWIFY